uniref:DAO domain-containing protein n=1 Tax=Rhabditophanes sp. KR3021 TaxID=114890 RepID=A0AC35UGM6_9BILA
MLGRSILLNSRFLSSESTNLDVAIIGGGIVGCSIARQFLIKRPNLKIALFEKENRLAAHQSGHNSGVLHQGMYYKSPLKAKLCVEGVNLAYKYCDEKNIPYNKCGKLIVAVEPHEIPILDELYQRGLTNGSTGLRMVDSEEIIKIEPNCRGLKAIWSPETGIVDWGLVTTHFAKDFEAAGGSIHLNHTLTGVNLSKSEEYPIELTLKGKNSKVNAKYLVTASGLYADKVAQLTGCSPNLQIIPFRGEYLKLKNEKKTLVKTNIYPVPTPGLPFLGVHFTPKMNGDILLGPNAVLSFKREGYSYFDISLGDLKETLSYKGMQKLVWKYLRFGVDEMYRSIFINQQVKQLQRFVPSLNVSDVEPGLTGVRAQALDLEGNLVDEFIFDTGKGKLADCVLHVVNAPSPGATSSLAIARVVFEKAEKQFKL